MNSSELDANAISKERNTPMKLPLEDHLPYAVLALTVDRKSVGRERVF